MKFSKWLEFNADFSQFLISELFGDFNYQLPEDKEQQLYDFYMLAFINVRSSFDRRSQEMRMDFGKVRNPDPTNFDQEDKQDFMMKEVVLTLIPALKANLLDAVFYSLCAEIRHIFDTVKDTMDEIVNKVREGMSQGYAELLNSYIEKYKSREENYSKKTLDKLDNMRERDVKNHGYKTSFDAFIKTGASEEQIVTLMKFLYSNLRWSASYGGKAWANIANGWLKLYQAKTEAENFIYIDHIYDLQHNTDTVFNKLKSYMKGDSYSWIKRALDHKRDIKEPHEIIDLVSPSMKRLALRVIKMKFGKTYEDFLKQKEKEPIISKFDEPEEERERRSRRDEKRKQLRRYQAEVDSIETEFEGEFDLFGYYVEVSEADDYVYVSFAGSLAFSIPEPNVAEYFPKWGDRNYQRIRTAIKEWASDKNIYNISDIDSYHDTKNLEIRMNIDSEDDPTPEGFRDFLSTLQDLEKEKEELRASFYQLMIKVGIAKPNQFYNHMHSWDNQQFKNFDWDAENESTIEVSLKEPISLGLADLYRDKKYSNSYYSNNYENTLKKNLFNEALRKSTKALADQIFQNQQKQKTLFPKFVTPQKTFSEEFNIIPEIELRYEFNELKLYINIKLMAHHIDEHIDDAVNFIHFIDNNYNSFVKNTVVLASLLKI